MAPAYHQEFQHAKEAIKLRVPIEEVVRERVPGLKKRGRLWTACCPFHEEKTPSFKVDPSRGTWRCYGACAAGGDVISFLERHDHLDFLEALETLAARCGVELPKRRGGADAKPRGADDALFAVLERATAFYHRTLTRAEGAAALAYLRGRGLSANTIEAFALGFSPAGGEVLVSKVIAQGESLDPLLATGLARRNEQGRAYDFFRGRLMIPIRDERGRTVGFGARRLDDSDPRSPKYVNTGETEVFHKGRLVYALDRAMAEIRRTGRMILVEGYTDVMAAHQTGLANVVAVLGTALTDEHAALVRRSGAKRVTLCFDGDTAGEQATWRALPGLVPLDVVIDVVRLDFGSLPPAPSGASVKDPCDLLIQHGPAAFQAQLDRAVGWFDFLLAALPRGEGPALWQAVDRVLELLARLSNPVERDRRLQELAARIASSASAVRERYQSLAARGRRSSSTQPVAEAEAARTPDDSVPRAIAPRRRTRDQEIEEKAWEGLLGAVLRDGRLSSRLAAQLAAWELSPESSAGDSASSFASSASAQPAAQVPGAELLSIARTLSRLASDPRAIADHGRLFDAFAGDPARDRLVPLLEDAETAESAELLFDDACARLERLREERALARRKAELATRARADLARQDELADSEILPAVRARVRQAAQAVQAAQAAPVMGEATTTESDADGAPARVRST